VRIRSAVLTVALLLILLTIGMSISSSCSSQPPVNGQPVQSELEKNEPENAEPPTASSTAPEPSVTSPSPESVSPVTVVIAGYINHGPMQPTVRAIQEVLAKYDDRVAVSWIDLTTAEGQTYFQKHGLTAHLNVIINGTSTYQVDGKTVVFEWFEGQQWTKEELDAVLANLINN